MCLRSGDVGGRGRDSQCPRAIVPLVKKPVELSTRVLVGYSVVSRQKPECLCTTSKPYYSCRRGSTVRRTQYASSIIRRPLQLNLTAPVMLSTGRGRGHEGLGRVRSTSSGTRVSARIFLTVSRWTSTVLRRRLAHHGWAAFGRWALATISGLSKFVPEGHVVVFWFSCRIVASG